MNKFLIRFFKIGIIGSFIGSICFTAIYLPWFITHYIGENQEMVKYIYLVISSLFQVPFGLALIQAFKLLNLLESDTLFNFHVVKRLKLVRVSGVSIAVLHILAICFMLFLHVFHTVMALLSVMIIVVALMVSAFIYLLEVVLSKASVIKEDNDLFI